jgi:hypothetical protein
MKLQEIVYLAQQGDNLIISKWLEKLEEIINNTSNDQELGEKIREI